MMSKFHRKITDKVEDVGYPKFQILVDQPGKV